MSELGAMIKAARERESYTIREAEEKSGWTCPDFADTELSNILSQTHL